MIHRAAVALIVAGTLSGCATSRAERFVDTAADLGFVASVVPGKNFRHRVFSKSASQATLSHRLHVYIDGDGITWLGPGRVSLEPTSRDPLVLSLMKIDPASAVYLGRPCYAGIFDPQSCNPWQWTHGRYSNEVVDSMVAALGRLLRRYPDADVVLIGYSGGGALAMLMAPHLDQLTAVVTLAGNLDIAAWVGYHQYSPLVGSLNPADMPPLRDDVRQVHWVGEEDDSVPPQVVRSGLGNQNNATLFELPGVDHSCCWVDRWPGMLETISETVTGRKEKRPAPRIAE